MEQFFSGILRPFASNEFYVSLPFWGAVAAVVLLCRLAPRVGALKDLLLLLSSTCLLLTLPRFNIWMLATLFIVCVITYLIAKVLLKTASAPAPKPRQWLAATGVVLNILVLAF